MQCKSTLNMMTGYVITVGKALFRQVVDYVKDMKKARQFVRTLGSPFIRSSDVRCRCIITGYIQIDVQGEASFTQ